MSKRIRFIVALFLLLLLSACTVRTMYSYDSNMETELASVGLGKIDGKEPYLIRQSFRNEFYMNEDDLRRTKEYELYLNVADSVEDWLLQSNSTVLRKNLRVTVHFSLKEVKTDKVVASGASRALIVFPESPSAWSSYVSTEKAYENAVHEAMRSVRIQVSLYLAKQQKKEEHGKNKSKKLR